ALAHGALDLEDAAGHGAVHRGLAGAHRDGSGGGGRSRLSRGGGSRSGSSRRGRGGRGSRGSGSHRGGAYIGDAEGVGGHPGLLSDGGHHHGHQLALIHRGGGGSGSGRRSRRLRNRSGSGSL